MKSFIPLLAMLVLLVQVQSYKKKVQKKSKSMKSRRQNRSNESIPSDSIMFMAYGDDGELKRNIVKKVELNVPKVDECNFAKKREYPFCLTLTSCELCVRAPRCGWCGATKQCVATACNRECPAVQGHPTMKHTCGYDPTTVYGGTFSTLSTEATRTINPEIAKPKVAITTSKVTQGTSTLEKQIGQQSLEERLSLKNFGGHDNYNTHKITTQPQYASTTFSFPIKTAWNREYYDMATGASLAHEKVLHGEDNQDQQDAQHQLQPQPFIKPMPYNAPFPPYTGA